MMACQVGNLNHPCNHVTDHWIQFILGNNIQSSSNLAQEPSPAMQDVIDLTMMTSSPILAVDTNSMPEDAVNLPMIYIQKFLSSPIPIDSLPEPLSSKQNRLARPSCHIHPSHAPGIGWSFHVVRITNISCRKLL
jgi:hypothetical protein